MIVYENINYQVCLDKEIINLIEISLFNEIELITNSSFNNFLYETFKKKINKIIFAGDTDSINLEIVCNSHKYLKNKVNYYLVGDIVEIYNQIKKLKKQIKINEIRDPFDFTNLKKDSLNIYDLKKITLKLIILLLK